MSALILKNQSLIRLRSEHSDPVANEQYALYWYDDLAALEKLLPAVGQDCKVELSRFFRNDPYHESLVKYHRYKNREVVGTVSSDYSITVDGKGLIQVSADVSIDNQELIAYIDLEKRPYSFHPRYLAQPIEGNPRHQLLKECTGFFIKGY